MLRYSGGLERVIMEVDHKITKLVMFAFKYYTILSCQSFKKSVCRLEVLSQYDALCW